MMNLIRLEILATLAIDVVDGVANFTHDEVLNARQIKLFDNGQVILTESVLPGESFNRTWNPIKLGLRSYQIKAYRDSQETNFSNTVTTNITSLTDMPPDLLYPESVWLISPYIIYWGVPSRVQR